MSPDCHSMVVVAKLMKYRHENTHIYISQYSVIVKIMVELSSHPIICSYYYYHHHLALQPFVGFRLLSQASPSSSILSCFLLVFPFSFFRSSMTSSCHRCLVFLLV